MKTLSQIAERLRTQDNRCTDHPYFLVQELIRIYGIDTDYDPQIAWLDEDSEEVDPELAETLEASYQETYEEPTKGGYRRIGYHEQWKFVHAFLTEAAADEYIAKNSHRHSGRLRTYAESAYRNPEIQAHRKIIMDNY